MLYRKLEVLSAKFRCDKWIDYLCKHKYYTLSGNFSGNLHVLANYCDGLSRCIIKRLNSALNSAVIGNLQVSFVKFTSCDMLDFFCTQLFVFNYIFYGVVNGKTL